MPDTLTRPTARTHDPMPDSPRHAPLEMSSEEFRRAGHALVDRVAELLGGMTRGPVTAGHGPGDVRALLGGPRGLPDQGTDAEALLSRTADTLFRHSLHNGHPRFLGYITSSAAPVGMLGELLAASVNANVGAWVLSPVASEIEAETVRWIAELIGYPVDSGGLLVSGGNMANLTAFWAARAAVAGADIRTAGARAVPDLTIYCSEGTHTWVEKAADLSGIGTDSVRWIRTDADGRMDPAALEAAVDWDVDQGRRPLMVVGTAGSVGIGAVDDLRGIAELCRARGIWFHVDGAYGGLAAMLPDAPEGLRHLGLADSIAVDPHKWLYAPLEAGCVLVRDPQHLRDAFAYHPPYFHFGEEAVNYVDMGPQNSRGFRALKIWLALQQVGRSGYEAMLAEDIRLAGLLFETAARTPGLEAFTHNLSITTFRYVPEELRDRRGEPGVERYLNHLNERLLERLENGGEVFLSNAVLDGRYVLRGCIVNFRTSEADVRAIPEIVVREGAAIHAELGGPEASPSA